MYKGPYSQSYGFPSSHVQMWELDHKEDWELENWYFQTVVPEKTLESPLNSKEIKSVSSKGNQPWILIGRIDAEAEAPIPWPPDAKRPWKRPWCWERLRARTEGATEDPMVGWHRWLNGHEFEQILGHSEEQGSLVCCSLWGHRVWHDIATEQQKCTIRNFSLKLCSLRLTCKQVLTLYFSELFFQLKKKKSMITILS